MNRLPAPRAPRQIAAVLCAAVVGYLSLATSCLRGGSRLELEGRTMLEAGRTERALAVISLADGTITMVEISTAGTETLRIVESQVDPDADPDGLPLTSSQEGVLTVDCFFLSNGCEEVRFVVEREQAEADVEVELHVMSVANGGCGGDDPEFFELRLEELD